MDKDAFDKKLKEIELVDGIYMGDLVMSIDTSCCNLFHRGGIYLASGCSSDGFLLVACDDMGHVGNGLHKSQFVKVDADAIPLAELLYG